MNDYLLVQLMYASFVGAIFVAILMVIDWWNGGRK